MAARIRKQDPALVQRAKPRYHPEVDIDFIVLHFLFTIKPCVRTNNVAIYLGMGSYPYMSPRGEVECWQWTMFIKDWHRYDGESEKRYGWRAWWVRAEAGYEIQRYAIDRHRKVPRGTFEKFMFLRDRAYRKHHPTGGSNNVPIVIAKGDGDYKLNDVVNGEYRWFHTNIYTQRFEHTLTAKDKIERKLPKWSKKNLDELPYHIKRHWHRDYKWEIDYAKRAIREPDYDEQWMLDSW